MKIVVELYKDHEMARIKVGGRSVFTGNYWDFHRGCHGPIICIGGKEIDFSEEWAEHINRPLPVARMIARKLGGAEEDVTTICRAKPFKP